jgi:hypothetical protein
MPEQCGVRPALTPATAGVIAVSDAMLQHRERVDGARVQQGGSLDQWVNDGIAITPNSAIAGEVGMLRMARLLDSHRNH